jgi:SAM-dependent methyltransferase
MPEHIDRSEGRRLFGLDPQGYGDARPPYPDALYTVLVEEAGLGPGTSTLEIGAGPGIATRKLITLGAAPLTVLEPDRRFRPMLDAIALSAQARVDIREIDFESYDAPPGSFDLIAAATSFHWVRPDVGLAKATQLLRTDGHVALWWNVLSVLGKADPFHDATLHLLRDLAVSPSGGPESLPFALDRAARVADFDRTGAFERVSCFEKRWTHVLGARGIRRLYEGFSHIQRLDTATRERLLDALMEVAERQFAGVVERNVTSVLYVARRRTRA